MPYLVFMDAQGTVLSRVPRVWPLGVKELASGKAEAEHYLVLERKANKTPAEEVQLFKLKLRYETLSLKQAKATRERLKLPKAQDQQVASMIGVLEATLALKEADQHIRSLQDLKEKGAAIGKNLYEEFHLKGKTPEAPAIRGRFYMLILEYGTQKLVVPAAEAAARALEKQFAGNPRAKQFLAKINERVSRLKAKVKSN